MANKAMISACGRGLVLGPSDWQKDRGLVPMAKASSRFKRGGITHESCTYHTGGAMSENAAENALFERKHPVHSRIKEGAFGTKVKEPSIFCANFSGFLAEPGERCRFARQFNKDFRDYNKRLKRSWSSDGIDHDHLLEADGIDLDRVSTGLKVSVRMTEWTETEEGHEGQKHSVKHTYQKAGTISNMQPEKNTVHIYYWDGTVEAHVSTSRCRLLSRLDQQKFNQRHNPIDGWLARNTKHLAAEVQNRRRAKLTAIPDMRRFDRGAVTMAATLCRPNQHISVYSGFGARGRAGNKTARPQAMPVPTQIEKRAASREAWS